MPADVLVLDIGKTHARAITFDARGEIVARDQRSFAALSGPPYRHLPIPTLLNFVESAIVTAAAGRSALTVIPVTHGAAIALIDAKGLVLPVLDYEDPAPKNAVGYDEARAPFAETFSPALPLGLNLGRQLAWLEQAFPCKFARATAFLTLPQFISWHLTGHAASERTSLGCHTDLWAPIADDLSSLAVARGWRTRFPPMCIAGEVMGRLRPAIATRLGVTTPIAVLNGLHDSNASLVPHLGRADAFTMISTGTWFIAIAVGGALGPDLAASRDCLANVDVRGRPYPCARFMGGREFAALAGDATPTLDDLPQVIAAVARGRWVLPSHAEGGGPFPGARGTIPPDVAPAERGALATLYLVLMTATCMELIGADGPIVIEGPAAANPLFAAILQALHPARPVGSATDTDATARGAAMLALGINAPPALTPAVRVLIPGLADYSRRWCKAAEARITV